MHHKRPNDCPRRLIGPQEHGKEREGGHYIVLRSMRWRHHIIWLAHAGFMRNGTWMSVTEHLRLQWYFVPAEAIIFNRNIIIISVRQQNLRKLHYHLWIPYNFSKFMQNTYIPWNLLGFTCPVFSRKCFVFPLGILAPLFSCCRVLQDEVWVMRGLSHVCYMGVAYSWFYAVRGRKTVRLYQIS